MQVASSVSVPAIQIKRQTAQGDDVMANPSSSPMPTKNAATQPTTGPILARPPSLLSPSLTQALINATQVAGAAAAPPASPAAAPTQSQPVASDWNPLDVFTSSVITVNGNDGKPVTASLVGTDSNGNVIQPLNLWPNVTQDDVATLDKTFGFTQSRNKSGVIETLDAQGQPVNSGTFSYFQQLGSIISYQRGHGQLAGDLTATSFSAIATEMSEDYGQTLTTSQLNAGLDFLASKNEKPPGAAAQG